jgi:hypothetical protein
MRRGVSSAMIARKYKKITHLTVASFAERGNFLQYEEKKLAGAICPSLGYMSKTRSLHAPFIYQADAACRVLF